MARENRIIYVKLKSADGKPEFDLLKNTRVGYNIIAFKVRGVVCGCGYSAMWFLVD